MDQQNPPLVCSSHTKQYAVIFVVGILIGAGSTFMYTKQSPAMYNSNDVPRLPSDFPGVTNIHSFNGQVVSVNSNSISIKVQPSPFFDESIPLDRIVVIANDTKITKVTQQDPKIFQSEMEAYLKKRSSGKAGAELITPPPPPIPTYTKVSAASLNPGNMIIVKADENVAQKKEFTATEIQIQ